MDSSITGEKEGKGYIFASATAFFNNRKITHQRIRRLPAITRKFLKRVSTGRGFELQPLEEGAA